LAGLATVLLLFFFCKKYLKNQLLGFCSAFVLLTSQGFISNHVTRTGDYDALLTFWTTLTVFFFFAWINSNNEKQKRNLLYASALSVAAAVLTKSIMGFVLLPPLFLYLIWKKQLRTLFTSTHFYGAVSIFLTIVLGYYFLRENQNPGYLEAVLENDVRGRYFETQEGNNRSFFFHMRKIYEERFVPWLYFLPLGFLATYFAKPRTMEFVRLLFFSGLFFLLVISFSQTNLIWYDAPLLSLWAVVVGLGIEKIIRMALDYFSKEENSFRFSKLILTGAIGLAIFGNPYFKRVSDSYTFNKLWLTPERELFEGFMHRSVPLEYNILHWDINGQVVFLQKLYQRKGFDIGVREINQLQDDGSFKFVESEFDFEIGEKVMMCESNVKNEFSKRYSYEEINNWSNCLLVRVITKK